MAHLVPIVALSVCEHLAARIYGTARDRHVAGQIGCLELGALVFVPKAELAVAAHCGQCHVLRMKGDVVDGEYVLRLVGLCRLAAVALEGEVVLGVWRVHVLNGHTALDGAEREPGRILVLVEEYAHAAVLKLERTLDRLHLLRLLVKVVHLDEAIGAAHDRHRSVDVRAVGALGQHQSEERIGLSQVPELERLVPAAGHHARVVGPHDVMDGLDGRVMLRYLHELIGLEVPHARRLVARRGEHLGAIGAPRSAQHGRVVGLDRLGKRLAAVLYLPAAYVVSPRRADQERLRQRLRAELEAANAVVRWLCYFDASHYVVSVSSSVEFSSLSLVLFCSSYVFWLRAVFVLLLLLER